MGAQGTQKWYKDPMKIKMEDGKTIEVTTHNESDAIDVNGTWLQGYITATYQHLLNLFGEPDLYVDNKVQVEWTLEYDGTVITIYDYKNYGIDPKRNTNWHVGGFDAEAARLAKKLIRGEKVES